MGLCSIRCLSSKPLSSTSMRETGPKPTKPDQNLTKLPYFQKAKNGPTMQGPSSPGTHHITDSKGTPCPRLPPAAAALVKFTKPSSQLPSPSAAPSSERKPRSPTRLVPSSSSPPSRGHRKRTRLEHPRRWRRPRRPRRRVWRTFRGSGFARDTQRKSRQFRASRNCCHAPLRRPASATPPACAKASRPASPTAFRPRSSLAKPPVDRFLRAKQGAPSKRRIKRVAPLKS